MDIETLKAEHPDVFKAVHDAGFEAGSTAQLERIKGVYAQTLPGHEALIQTLAFNGKTTGPEAAAAIVAAERKNRQASLDAQREDAPAPVKPQAEQEQPQQATGEDAWKAEFEKNEALRAEFGGNLNAFLAFKKAEAKGTIRIMTK